MSQELKTFAREIFVGVTELAAAAAKILAAGNTVQERETVTALPDERTIRYYITEGLISPADEKQGTSSLFGYLQLLQLLAVKKLQSENLSIRQIRLIVSGKTASELEKFLTQTDQTATKNEAQQFLESLLMKPPTKPIMPPLAPPSFAARKRTSVSASRAVNIWKRFEIAEGLEIHIHENFAAPDADKLLEQIRQVIEQNQKGRK